MDKINFYVIFAESYFDLARQARQNKSYSLAQELALNAYGFFKRENRQGKMRECREYFCDREVKNADEIIVEMDGLLRMMNKIKEVHSRFTLSLLQEERKEIIKNTLIGILEQQGHRNIFRKSKNL